MGARSLRNVAGGDAVDDSLDDSGSARRLAPGALVGVVETALGEALRLAAEAQRWELVAQLADELLVRRNRRAGSKARRRKTGRLATGGRAR